MSRGSGGRLLAEALGRILHRTRMEGEQLGEVVGEIGNDFYLKAYPHGVVNICGRGRALRAEDVAAFRAALAEVGHAEVESWVASQGMSWLPNGTDAGISFRIEKVSGP